MSVARRAANQLLASKSVHIRIQPRPANLSESREIFRVLQRFGEISTYKYLRYEYHSPADNSAIAIYRDADAAQQALNASPIRFSLERVVEDDEVPEENQSDDYEASQETNNTASETPVKGGIEELTRPSELLQRPFLGTFPMTNRETKTQKQSIKEPPMPFQDQVEPRKTTPKWFQLTLDHSRTIHQDYVERQPWWKQFSPMKSMGQADLAKSVPHIGLSDVSKRPINQHRTPNKVLNLMAHHVEHRMKTLRELYDEGSKEKP